VGERSDALVNVKNHQFHLCTIKEGLFLTAERTSRVRKYARGRLLLLALEKHQLLKPVGGEQKGCRRRRRRRRKRQKGMKSAARFSLFTVPS
jgi:hypothetical protein